MFSHVLACPSMPSKVPGSAAPRPPFGVILKRSVGGVLCCILYSAALVSSSMIVFNVTAVRPSAPPRTRRVRSAAEGAPSACAKAAKRARSASVNEPVPSLAMSLRPYANAAWRGGLGERAVSREIRIVEVACGGGAKVEGRGLREGGRRCWE